MIGMALVTILMAVGMAACGSDDDEDLGNGEPANPATHDTELIGTWAYEYEDAEEYDYEEYTFYKDGTGKYYEDFTEDGEHGKYSENFVWSTEDNNLTIKITSGYDKGETEEYVYRVEGNTLYLDGERYTKK